MAKHLSELGYDNTLKIKNESARNERMIRFIDSHVAPIASIRIGDAPKVGDTVYNAWGMIPGVLKEIDGKHGIVEIKPKGEGKVQRAVKMEEIKSSPWTKEELETYFTHRRKESERMDAETKVVAKAFEEREKLAKQFTGR
jgi:hypothetical protein